ncbi:MAG: hypothetical protein D6714_09745 [Bacteroidetes bacterium]|nr:MAG: hypothetical protein D6714_09745 [Bacteroidota bacterium]
MKKILVITNFLCFLAFGLAGQSVVRSTLCGVGVTQFGNNATLTSTFASGCIGCTTLTGNNAILTQGFQQPDDQNSDCYLVTFDYDFEISACGLTFNFFYTGTADLNNVTLEWDFGDGAFPQTSNSPNPMGIAYSTTGQKMVKLRVFDGADCDLSAATNLTVNSVGFAANPLISDVACKGEANGRIELELTGGTAPFTYIWSNGETAPVLENLPAGDYAYTVTDGAGCESINTVSVFEPQDSLMVNFDVVSETCKGDLNGALAAVISGGTAPYTVQWSNGETTPDLTGITTGEYTISVLDQKGCFVEKMVFVPEKCSPRIYNTISPNGDGINDFWVIPDIESFPDNEVRVYNRWGEQVFKATGYLNTWAGTTTSGKPLVAGAYYYVVRLNDPDDTVLSGAITIIR